MARVEAWTGLVLLCTACYGFPDPPGYGVLVIAVETPSADGTSMEGLTSLRARVDRVDVVHRSRPDDPWTEGVLTLLAEPTELEFVQLDQRIPMELLRLQVPAGVVEQVRFATPGGEITLHGVTSAVGVPSGPQTGVKIVPADGRPFPIVANEVTAVLVTFDASHSIVENRGTGYKLKPVLYGTRIDPSRLSLFLLDEMIVAYRPEATAAQIAEMNARYSVTVLADEPLVRMQLLKLPPTLSINDAVRAYASRTDIVGVAMVNILLTPPRLPNDNPAPGLLRLGAERAWDLGVGGYAGVVAIVDSGIDLDHPDLIQNIWVNETEALAVIGDRNGDGVVDVSDGDLDGDGIISFIDLNRPELSSHCDYARNPNSPANICDPLDLVDGDPTVNVGLENGIDDDLNGLTDDLFGWDFADWDNVPNDDGMYIGHGTLVAGAVAAVGDNAAGGSLALINEAGDLAGTAWKARLLALRQRGELFEGLRAMSYANYKYKADVAIFSGSFALGENAPSLPPPGCPYWQPPELDVDAWGRKLDCLWGITASGCQTLNIAPATDCGIDASDPGILVFPAEHGFRTNALSVTGVVEDLSVLCGDYGAGAIDLASIGTTRVLELGGGSTTAGCSVSTSLGSFAGAVVLVLGRHPAWKGQPCALKQRLFDNAEMGALPVGWVTDGRLLRLDRTIENAAEPPTPLRPCDPCPPTCFVGGGGAG